MTIVVLGLSITSSWGNGHATTYRALVRALAARGHEVVFLERDVPWYAATHDLPQPGYCRTALYDGLETLERSWQGVVEGADLVVVGSYVPDGAEVGDWVLRTAGGLTAFYDIDTPVTLATLDADRPGYLRRDQIPCYDLYLSFTGGPVLVQLEQTYGARRARALYCSVDPAVYRPVPARVRWHLGYLGTYSPDRQPALEARLLEPARRWSQGRFVVAGPQFPPDVAWPSNVHRITHLAPRRHPAFYRAQRFTLNVTRAAMIQAGYSPSVRLFEAAACGTPIVSDAWPGLDRFFEPGREILISGSAEDTLRYLRDVSEGERRAIGERARARVLAAHTADHRAAALETFCAEVEARGRSLRRAGARGARPAGLEAGGQ